MKHLNLLSRSLEGGVFSVALVCTGYFLLVILGNMPYPLGFGVIQWHIMENVQRVRDGLPLYVEPSMEFIPDLYTPLYYYVTALFSLFLGVSLLAGKWVSLTAVLGSGACIYAWLRKEQISAPLAFCGAALFLASYVVYDLRNYLVRVDSLFCFLLIYGSYLLYCGRQGLSAIGAGVVFCLAFMTKQSALIVVIPLIVSYLIFGASPRREYFIKTFLICFIVSVLALNYVSAGWFLYFIVSLPMQHEFNKPQWAAFWTALLPHAWPAIMLSIAALVYLFTKESFKKAALYTSLFAGLSLCSYIMRLHVGGEINTLMPVFLALALFTPLAFRHNEGTGIRVTLLLLLCLQFFLLNYVPARFIPTEKLIASGNKYLEYLGNIEGDILVEGGGYYPTRAGKKTYNINTSLWDIQRSNDEELKEKLNSEFESAIKQKKFSAIITYYENPDRRYIRSVPRYNIGKYYHLKERIDDSLTPEELEKIGWKPAKPIFKFYIQPHFVFVPNE